MISNLNTGIVSTATGSLSVSNSFIGHNINDSVLISANYGPINATFDRVETSHNGPTAYGIRV